MTCPPTPPSEARIRVEGGAMGSERGWGILLPPLRRHPEARRRRRVSTDAARGLWLQPRRRDASPSPRLSMTGAAATRIPHPHTRPCSLPRVAPNRARSAFILHPSALLPRSLHPSSFIPHAARGRAPPLRLHPSSFRLAPAVPPSLVPHPSSLPAASHRRSAFILPPSALLPRLAPPLIPHPCPRPVPPPPAPPHP
jgi:hypothetical protein